MNQNKKAVAKTELTQPQAFDTLRRLMGKKFIYKNQQIEILEVSEEDNTHFIVLTGGKNLRIAVAEVLQFISEIYPLENIMPQVALQPTQAVQPASRQEGMLDDMTETLFEVFKNIKKHPTRENIDQATTLSNTANTVANLLKLRIQAEKLRVK